MAKKNKFDSLLEKVFAAPSRLLWKIVSTDENTKESIKKVKKTKKRSI